MLESAMKDEIGYGGAAVSGGIAGEPSGFLLLPGDCLSCDIRGLVLKKFTN